MNENILEVKNLNVYFREKNNNIKIIDDVSFSVKESECLGILGESGSGKSMTIKSILRLLDNNFRVEGEVLFNNIDLIKESSGNIRKLRGNKICMILQNPMTCFDPLYRIYNQMQETFLEHTDLNKKTNISKMYRYSKYNENKKSRRYNKKISSSA